MSISNPSERQLLMAGYILGDLDLEESRAFEEILSSDATLQQDLAQLQTSLDMVYGQEIVPPPALKASVLEQADRQSSRSVSGIFSLPERRSREATQSVISKQVLWLVTGALALLSLYLGSQNYLLRRTIQANRLEQINPSNVEDSALLATYSLSATEDSTDSIALSSVELLIETGRINATLNVEGLPALPPDQVYVLWTVTAEDAVATTDDKRAILTATFTVDEGGDRTQEIVLPSVFRDQEQVEKLAVTIEDADAPQKHESSPILIYQL